MFGVELTRAARFIPPQLQVISQLKAQGPYRTCNESKEAKWSLNSGPVVGVGGAVVDRPDSETIV
jgi:hypothetical protein